MPKRKAIRKKRGTRRLKRRKIAYRSKLRRKNYTTRGVKTTIRQGTYIADKTIVKLKLGFILQQTNDSKVNSGLAVSLVQPNSLFDPMASSGSLQPYMFDQYAALYQFYLVHGVHVMIKGFFTATALTSSSAREYGLCWSNSSSALDIQNYRDQVYAKHRMIQFSGYSAAQCLKSYMPLHRLYGNSREQYVTNTNLQAGVGASPSVPLYLHIWSVDPFVSTDNNTNLQVDMTFYCEFNGRKQLAA